MDSSSLAAEFAGEVARSVDGVLAVVLYGSVARREEGEESDIDVLVIARGNLARVRDALAELATDFLLRTRVYVSAKAVRPEEFRRMAEGGNEFVRNVLREGVVLHGALP
jgi:predicted nucleotidyltransferase